jgi:hypothetical protein
MGRRRERDEGRSRGGGGWVASASGSSRIFFFPSFLRVLFARILGVCRRVCLCARATCDANLFVF